MLVGRTLYARVIGKLAAVTLIAGLALLSAAGAAAGQATRALYLASTGTDVHGRSIAENGTLSPLSGSPYDASRGLEGIALAPDGRFLWAGDYNGGTWGFRIEGGGRLSVLPGSPYVDGTGAYGLAVAPSGRLLLKIDSISASITSYTVGDNGVPTPVAGSPFEISPRSARPTGIAISPDGRFAFVVQNRPDLVAVYRISDQGVPSPTGVSAGIGESGYPISITPDGRFLYVGNADSDTISAFAIGGDGELTPVPGQPFAAGDGPFGSAITPDGRRLYVANFASGEITGHAIASNGSLAPLPGSPYPVGGGPTSLAVTPDARLLYASNGAEDEVTGFAIAVNGSLAELASSPFGAATADFQALAITPEQPPRAALSLDLDGTSASFDASGSHDPGGEIAGYSWDFGDGSALQGGPTQTHTFKRGDTYTATVTVTDSEGCSDRYISSGQSPLCNGSSVARAEAVIDLERPSLKLSGDRRQRLGGPVAVKVSCDEPCTARATGTLKLGSRSFALRAVEKKLGTDRPRRLVLKLPGEARSTARNASSGRAKVRVEATDSAGNSARTRRAIKLSG